MLISAGMEAIAHDFTASEYRAAAAGYQVTAIVHVSATTAPRAYLDEARWIDEMARSTGWPAAAIGTIDPGAPWHAIQSDLAAQAQRPLFRGIRVLYGLDPESRLAERLLRWLAASGLVFDLVAHPHEVPAYRALLDRVPGLTVVVEHAGWPERADEFPQWRQAITTLAQRPGTYCKLSGLAMTLHSVSLDAQRPWLEAAIEAFGAQRCMFASNFPVDSLFGTFGRLYATYEAVAGELDAAARQALFAGTARQVYRL
jgi:L-fuconolactonase